MTGATGAGPGQVALWMTRTPVTVAPGCPVDRVVRLMRTERIRHVVVLDGDRLVGIASDRDVRGGRRGDAGHVSAAAPISEVMTETPVTASPTTLLTEAARAMLDRKIGALPIVQEGRLVGILTKSDVLEALLAWVERAREA